MELITPTFLLSEKIIPLNKFHGNLYHIYSDSGYPATCTHKTINTYLTNLYSHLCDVLITKHKCWKQSPTEISWVQQHQQDMYPQPSNSHRLCLGLPSSLGFCISPSTYWLLTGSCCLEGPLAVASNHAGSRTQQLSRQAIKQRPTAWITVKCYRDPHECELHQIYKLPKLNVELNSFVKVLRKGLL